MNYQDYLTPDDILDGVIGHIMDSSSGPSGQTMCTSYYMKVRLIAANAALRADTTPAIKDALFQFIDILRLDTNDPSGVGDTIPFLLLRLGRDKECYCFLKWWSNKNWDGVGDDSHTDKTYDNCHDDEENSILGTRLRLPKADLAEPTDSLQLRKFTLGQLVALTLLKLRLCLSLDEGVGQGLIPESGSSQFMRSDPWGHSRKSSPDPSSKDRRESQSQYHELCRIVQEANSHFWALLVNDSGQTPVAPSKTHVGGSIEEAYWTVRHCKRAWQDTEGAIALVDADTMELTSVHQGPVKVANTPCGISQEPKLSVKFDPPTASSPSELFPEIILNDRTVHRFVCHHDPQKALVYIAGACSDDERPCSRVGWAFISGNPVQGFESIPSVIFDKLDFIGPYGGITYGNQTRAKLQIRAELQAAIAALRICDWRGEGFRTIVLATDSGYVVDGATSRYDKWLRDNWKTKDGRGVPNRDLWEWFQDEADWCSGHGLQVEFWKIPRDLNRAAAIAAKAATEEVTYEDTGLPVMHSRTFGQNEYLAFQKPKVMGLCLDGQKNFIEHLGLLNLIIPLRTSIELFDTPVEALAALHQETLPSVVLVSDSALMRHREILVRVIDLLRAGTIVVLAGSISLLGHSSQLDRLFATIGLPWRHAGQYAKDQILDREVVGAHLADRLPSTGYLKALCLKNVDRSSIWYTPSHNSREAAVVFAPVGAGKLGYIGHATAEELVVKTFMAMCGLFGQYSRKRGKYRAGTHLLA